MNKKFICAVCSFFILTGSSIAQEDGLMFDSLQTFDKYNNYEAKPTSSDVDINNAIQKVKNLNKSKRKLKKEKEAKGEPLQKGLSGLVKKPYELIQIPSNVHNNGIIIPKGFYKAIYHKKSNSLILKQGYENIAIIKMNKAIKEPETDDLYYTTAIIKNGYVKINYGAIDIHLEKYLKIAN